MLDLDEMDFLNGPRIASLRQKVKEAQDEAEKKAFIESLVVEVVNKLNNVTISKIDDSVAINNLDEVRAALRNELGRISKPLVSALKDLKMSGDEQTAFLRDVEDKGMERFKAEFQPVYIKKPRDKVEVLNLSDIIIPDMVSVKNLSELKQYFDGLSESIGKSLKIEIPAPQVKVDAPVVNVPETVLNVPEVDLTPVVEALKRYLNKLSTNDAKRPLAVRLSDGQKFINELKAIVNQQRQAFAGFSDVTYIKDAGGGRINPATEESVGPPTSIGNGNKNVTTAGTSVQLTATSTPCRYVVIVGKAANTGIIYVGGSAVASTNGEILYASQSTKVDIDNLNKIYIDSSVNGEGVQYRYVA